MNNPSSGSRLLLSPLQMMPMDWVSMWLMMLLPALIVIAGVVLIAALLLNEGRRCGTLQTPMGPQTQSRSDNPNGERNGSSGSIPKQRIGRNHRFQTRPKAMHRREFGLVMSREVRASRAYPREYRERGSGYSTEILPQSSNQGNPLKSKFYG